MSSMECPLCLEQVRTPYVSKSGHIACKLCIEGWYDTAVAAGNPPLSPNTRTPMSPGYYEPLYIRSTAKLVQTQVEKEHFVAILDCSGSMSTASKSGGESSPSRISMMIHMVKMLARIFRESGNYFSLMQFSSSCSSLINKSLDVPDQLIESLRPRGGTDMVGALTTAVSLHGVSPTYIMFTDGEPDLGTEAATARVAKSFDGLKLHVVGFGPRLNNDVMFSLAKSGQGTYTYIFDINTSSVMMSSLAAYLASPPNTMASLGLSSDVDTYLEFITALEQLVNSSQTVANMVYRMSGFPKTPYFKALADDIQHDDADLGQINKALQNRSTWGNYYLSSILRAHQLRYPMSDLERSLQYYASDSFVETRAHAMALIGAMTFCPVTEIDVYNASVVAQVIVKSTESTGNRGGCFSGDAEVSGGIKVRDLRRGDKVASRDLHGQDTYSVVDCIVQYKLSTPMPLYGGFITPYHPVLTIRGCCFPIDVFGQDGVADYVYNIMLQPNNGVYVYVNGVPCVTLAHNINGDPVAEHPYFGTDVVRADIMVQPGYSEGFVRTTLEQTQRDVDGLVCGMF